MDIDGNDPFKMVAPSKAITLATDGADCGTVNEVSDTVSSAVSKSPTSTTLRNVISVCSYEPPGLQVCPPQVSLAVTTERWPMKTVAVPPITVPLNSVVNPA